MRFKPFSRKQRLALEWWALPETSSYDAVICDGAVRSGKTLCMSLGFVLWAAASFDGTSFAVCGKTITSLRRNVITPLLQTLRSLGFSCEEKTSRNYADISLDGVGCNRFYFFGGKDEGSAALIQGMTLGGVLLDEVALMPRSFVEQAIARCSLPGSRLWFNCNPEHPGHWFYREWICRRQEKNALYLHFTMKDNPSLTENIRRRYERLYSGAFYERFVLGKWTQTGGLVYPMFKKSLHVGEPPSACSEYRISCDYGTVNPSSFGLWGRCGEVWYRLREYYYDARREGLSRTDEEHYRELCALAGDLPVKTVIIDPSAASMIACIERHGRFRVIRADNRVLVGIQRTGEALSAGKIRISPACTDILREFTLYCWDEGACSDAPKKEHDHAMDDMRYFVMAELAQNGADCFFAASTRRVSAVKRKEG
ncbi:MAG: PBSX family phage terminase large subunit [Ruminococcus sp.]|nr:PBSX family phage terminase large subunit [Ruminococcus sp.]